METENIIKFQNLEENESYTVTSFKEIKSNFGISYILKVLKNGEDSVICVWSSKSTTKYIQNNKGLKTRPNFQFTVKRIKNGKY